MPAHSTLEVMQEVNAELISSINHTAVVATISKVAF